MGRTAALGRAASVVSDRGSAVVFFSSDDQRGDVGLVLGVVSSGLF